MTAYYNEIDPWCVRLLRKHIAAGKLPAGVVDDRDIREVQPDDLRGFDQVHLFAGIGGIPLGLMWAGVPDDFSIWTGGFPCQDISNAGLRAGIDGERSGLWAEYIRLVRVLRPRHVLVENVAALLGRGLDRVLGDLAASGYDAEWDCIPAAAVGAPHRRDRLFILAYADRQWQPQPQGALSDERGWFGDGGAALADPERQSLALGERTPGERSQPAIARSGWWDVEPPVGRVVDGLPGRVDRLRGLGNAVVPQVAQWIGERIMEQA